MTETETYKQSDEEKEVKFRLLTPRKMGNRYVYVRFFKYFYTTTKQFQFLRKHGKNKDIHFRVDNYCQTRSMPKWQLKKKRNKNAKWKFGLRNQICTPDLDFIHNFPTVSGL